ncbi:nuclear transport factor 2 family protein [Streptomyces sp. J2-1]|uniref:nuclear transport factor 2 family protein n=1 Tax=Streptomyces corallincola TaxID=2851888 RepID=UPI001C38C019|nr:nuclear transport factor 2 family protein [Streptomyces corallincola]MBV2355452.1 nuclear transport factor 2 family protein [Streptomyces corallincola]
MSHARISEALRALVFAPEPGVELSEAVDRFYSPDYTHRADGRTIDRESFTRMAAGFRDLIEEGTVTVLDEVSDGSVYAERHVFHIRLKDGTTQHREVALFGTLAEDGRFRHLSETGFDITPA